ncbi:MAG: hypothetical protein KDC48_01885 [Planctomycetes bacterium]|nr:hypothetical protein [Planctomycetota bacterium]
MQSSQAAPAALALTLLLAATATAQVHYFPDGRPWKNTAGRGPDKDVPGWFYNLGTTGMRVRLVEDAPTHLRVEYVFAGSPAGKVVQVGDEITGAGGAAFATPHRNGYGMKVFGPQGPILDFATALETAQTKDGRGRLPLTLLRDGKERSVELELERQPAFSATWPMDCERSDKLREELRKYLLATQRDDGSWGNPVPDAFAPLALLSLGDKQAMTAVEKCARFHARTTSARDSGSLINWRYCAAAIVLSEYYLATKAKWVPSELQEIQTFLLWSQYMDPAQMNPKSKETHPGAQPKKPEDKIGGWGHNPGFEGYGPICMLTGQGAISLALMQRCGVAVERAPLDAAYAFLARGTGKNGYVWYEDQPAGDKNWADMGRTGAAGVANLVSPYPEPVYAERARAHAAVIGEHPLSFPDTHGSPPMGMAWAAAAALADPAAFRKLLDANRWWFVLAQCDDGSFYYQPNRDNAGYGADSRVTMSAVVLFILTLPEHKLAISGRSQ